MSCATTIIVMNIGMFIPNDECSYTVTQCIVISYYRDYLQGSLLSDYVVP